MFIFDLCHVRIKILWGHSKKKRTIFFFKHYVFFLYVNDSMLFGRLNFSVYTRWFKWISHEDFNSGSAKVFSYKLEYYSGSANDPPMFSLVWVRRFQVVLQMFSCWVRRLLVDPPMISLLVRRFPVDPPMFFLSGFPLLG